MTLIVAAVVGLIASMLGVASPASAAPVDDPVGYNWTTRVSPADNAWRSVTYGNGLFVAVTNSNTEDQVMTSPDGVTWTSRATPSTNQWQAVR